MKIKTTTILAVLGISLFAKIEAAPLGTAFTYQGHLADAGEPANGSYDIRFILFDVDMFGFPIGPLLTNDNVAVSNGLFTVTLDFGPVISSASYWLEVGVRPGASTGSFTTLEPRQPLTPSPQALFAASAGTVTNSAITSAHLANNAVTAAHIANNAVNSADILNNTIVPADLNIASFDTTFWKVDGNGGTTPVRNFLGTTDNQALELKVNGQRAFRLEPSIDSIADPDLLDDGAPNVIGGAAYNYVLPGVVGATIGGGGATNLLGAAFSNYVAAFFGTIAGGIGNRMETNGAYSVIGGGGVNHIGPDVTSSVIAGGINNTNNSDDAAIGGGKYNLILANDSEGAIIAGGRFNAILGTGVVDGTISGGSDNAILFNASGSTIGGGNNNTNAERTFNATISGGSFNFIQTNASSGVIGGGGFNTIQTNADLATISGGVNNTVLFAADYAAISGGNANRAAAIGSSISGGQVNFVVTNAINSVIGGGSTNTIQTNAQWAVIGGGLRNVVLTNASFAAIPGGRSNVVASHGFAAGFNARATNQGAFVWSDSAGTLTASTNNDSVTFRARGGYRFFSDGANMGAFLAPGSGTFTSLSDRNAKEAFAPVNSREVLDKVAALPIQTWRYKGQDEAVRHIGPTAQDFRAAFGVGDSETGISTVDADGVALAAIQALHQALKAKDAEIDKLSKRLTYLEKHITTRDE